MAGNLYVFDTEADGLLDEAEVMHCLVASDLQRRKFFIFCDHTQLSDEQKEILGNDKNVEWLEINQIPEWINSDEVSGVIGHNIFGYDMDLLIKFRHLDSYDLNPPVINGVRKHLFDTLAMSRHLHPDRRLSKFCPDSIYNPVSGKKDIIGAHSLAAWSYRVTKVKPVIHDWRDQPLHVYVGRCISDVEITIGVWDMLMIEAKDNAIGGDWMKSLALANQSFLAMCVQERTGVPFDSESATKLINSIDIMMEEVRAEVEPKLPKVSLPKSKQPTEPQNPFKQDGTISSSGLGWAKKLGYDVNENALELEKIPAIPFKADGTLSAIGAKFLTKNEVDVADLDGCKAFIKSLRDTQAAIKPISDEDMEGFRRDLNNGVTPNLEAPMTLSNQAQLKLWLFESKGWIPTVWGTKDATVDNKKKPRSPEEIKEKLIEYIQNLNESPYKDMIYKEMNLKPGLTKANVVEKIGGKARYLITTPKLKDERGELCPGLSVLEDGMAADVVKWLSLRHRRTSIKALDEDKTTGWLNHPRLAVDGRLPAGSAGLTNTTRQKHRTVVNVPKADPKVLLGAEMRSLFYAEKGKLFLGWDADGLEARVGGMAAELIGGDGGAYSRAVMGIGGVDYHTENAKGYTLAAKQEVTRNAGKNLTYGITYGATPPKIAKMMGVSLSVGKSVVEVFWDTNPGLKRVKEYLEDYWLSTDKIYIMGIDGRKIFTRSKHSLLNCYFQSTGATIVDMTLERIRVSIRDEKLEGVERYIYNHDEGQYGVPLASIEVFKHDNEEDVKQYSDGKIWSGVRELNSGGYAKYYSRVGELASLHIEQVGKDLGSPITFGASYDIGRNWKETH